MKTIWKFPLKAATNQTLEMPVRAQPLTVQCQDGGPCLWALVDSDAVQAPFQVHIFGTGHPMPADPDLKYIGTFQMHEGTLVLHVFYK